MRFDGEKAYFDDDGPHIEAELSVLGHAPDQIGPFSVFSLHKVALGRLSYLSSERDWGDKSMELLKRINLIEGIHHQLETHIRTVT